MHLRGYGFKVADEFSFDFLLILKRASTEC